MFQSKIVFRTLLSLIVILGAAIAQAKDIKVVSQEFMPIGGSGADGKMAGVHFEVAKRVCDKLKYTCKFEMMPLARGLDEIKSGGAHIILGIAKNAEREEIANFPNGLTQVGYTWFVKKGEGSKYKSADDFKGKTVGVHGGSATHKDLQEQNAKLGGSMKIVEETTAETAPKKLAGGRYGDGAAIYCARAVCMFKAKQEKIDIEPVSFDGKLQSHSAGISKKGVDAAEFEKIKVAFAEVMKLPEVQKIVTENDLVVHPDNK